MSYAPHTNTDVHYQILNKVIPTAVPMIFGQFVEEEFGHSFEYAERRHADDSFAPEMPHIVYVGPDGQVRLAKVLKTVAYVVVDEDENGKPVIDKWYIKQHKIYDTSWVGRSK